MDKKLEFKQNVKKTKLRSPMLLTRMSPSYKHKCNISTISFFRPNKSLLERSDEIEITTL